MASKRVFFMFGNFDESQIIITMFCSFKLYFQIAVKGFLRAVGDTLKIRQLLV